MRESSLSSSSLSSVVEVEEQKLSQFVAKRDLLEEPPPPPPPPPDNDSNNEELECGTNRSSGETRYCQNASICLVADDSSKFECDCNFSFQQLKKVVAGSLCQYEATMFCMVGKKDDSTPVKNTISFCTNNGTCKQMIKFGDSHQGCDCPDGFEGSYCEFRNGGKRHKKISNTSRDIVRSKMAGIIMAVIALGVFVFLGIVVYRRYRERERERALVMGAVGATAELEFDVEYSRDDEAELFGDDDKNNNNNNNKRNGGGTIEITSKRKGGKMYASTRLEDDDPEII